MLVSSSVVHLRNALKFSKQVGVLLREMSDYELVSHESGVQVGLIFEQDLGDRGTTLASSHVESLFGPSLHVRQPSRPLPTG